MAATNIPAVLNDATAAAINSGVAVDAGLIPTKDALVLENIAAGNKNPYNNIIVVRTEDKDNPIYKKIVALYRTEGTKKILLEETKGSSIPLF